MQWQYYNGLVDASDDNSLTQSLLNAGQAGWELVAATSVDANNRLHRLYFKKLLSGSTEEPM